MSADGESKVILLVRLLNAIDQGRHSFEDLKDKIAEGGPRPSTRTLAPLSCRSWQRRLSDLLRSRGQRLSLRARVQPQAARLEQRRALRLGGAALARRKHRRDDRRLDRRGCREARRKLRRNGARARRPSRRRSHFASPRSHSTRTANAPSRCSLRPSAPRAAYASSIKTKRGEAARARWIPYGFIINAGRVYCVAYDHKRHDKRTFAVDSVSAPVVLAKTFVRPNGFNVEAYAAASISGVLAQRPDDRGARALCAARCQGRRRGADRRRLCRPSERADGSAEIAYRVADVDELVRWVLGWGAQAEILAPDFVRARIAELAEEIAQQVSSAPS